MSQENVDIIREGYELFNRTGKLDPDRYHSDFVYREFSWSPQPERRGFEGFDQWTRDAGEAWEEFKLEPLELVDLGDQVVAVVAMRARGRESGAPIEESLAVLWTLRNGKVARCALFREKSEALAAAGESAAD